MSKRITTLILAIVLLIQLSSIAYAHNKDDHDKYLSWVLFGDKSYTKNLSKKSDEYQALSALYDAVALCLDINNENKLKELGEMKIHGIPETYDEIKVPGGNHHRRYTHRGWNYKYYDNLDKQRKLRKEILLQTVNDVFNFDIFAGTWSILGESKEFGYDKQCMAFAEFLYYVHILTDIDGSDMNQGYSDMIKLALADNNDINDDNPDIYWEIERLLPIIITNHDTSYNGLIADIKLQAKDARDFIKNTPDLKNSYSQYQEYANKLLEKLANKMPSLLKNEEFFSNVFYKSIENAA